MRGSAAGGRPRPTIFDHDPGSLRATCEQADMPGYVADQVLGWVYGHGVTTPEGMTNIATRHRERLADLVPLSSGSVLEHQSASDGTQKLLIGWPGRGGLPVLGQSGSGGESECVMIPAATRRTGCLSSQVGCPVGCRFCASGIGGLDGNLTAGQIVEQAFRLGHLGVGRLTNVVFMGMGEPLANAGAVVAAIRTINAPWGLGIGVRRITVSTVGLPAGIRKLTEFELPVKLALSLHAPNDEIRRQLIPWAEYATIAELLDACDGYFRKTGREITLEYLLLRRVNDRVTHAEELATLARRLRATVNLIRYNEVRGLPYDRPTTADVLAFQATLRRRGVRAHIRASRGRDIAAACGQLRHERVSDSNSPPASASTITRSSDGDMS
ncbi:MAG: 23S rRNA (adenine(2503)-C(2))-methyltransferase RlmN [Phycisphaerales bacterium]|nr:23S rRNA (adenine(2503)-C(2))-methyltransferase RlmN [Phycisphaerales bacterium]